MTKERDKRKEQGDGREREELRLAQWREALHRLERDADTEAPDLSWFTERIAEARKREQAKSRREWALFIGAGLAVSGGALVALAAGWGWYAAYHAAGAAIALAALASRRRSGRRGKAGSP